MKTCNKKQRCNFKISLSLKMFRRKKLRFYLPISFKKKLNSKYQKSYFFHQKHSGAHGFQVFSKPKTVIIYTDTVLSIRPNILMLYSFSVTTAIISRIFFIYIIFKYIYSEMMNSSVEVVLSIKIVKLRLFLSFTDFSDGITALYWQRLICGFSDL